MIVQIETTTVCNAACVFCVHKTIKREKTHMQQSVFEETILDCTKIFPLERICLTGFGETLLDPEILNRIKLVKYYLKDVSIDLFTNGTNLSKYIDDLIFLKVDSIVLSLNAVNSEKRKAIMGIDEIFNDLDDIIHKCKNKINLTLSVIVDLGLMECGDAEELKYKYGNMMFPHLASNWAGKLFDMKIKPIKPCMRVWTIMHVLVDGRVALCCLDSEGEVILGNNLIEALSGDKLKYYKKMMQYGKRFELPLCGNCSTA